MVQEFNVLRCFSCKRFQVHQVKKANKWACKVCGEKQSTTKIYGQGSAPDCRRHVQKLNIIQGEREQLLGENAIDSNEEYICGEDEVATSTEEPLQGACCDGRDSVGSRWGKFIEVEVKNQGEDGEEQLWNGMPVTMDRTTFEGGKRKLQQKKKQKNNQHSEEFLPAKKRMKSQDFEYVEDDFHHDDFSKIRGSHKVSGKKWGKTKTKWEILNSSTEEGDQDDKMLAHNNNGTSKLKNFATLQTESESYGSFKNHTPLNELDARNSIKSNQEGTLSNKIYSQNNNKGISASKPKTTQSKWLKFLGASSRTNVEEEGEDENSDDLKFDACERNLVKSKTTTPKELTCNKTVDSGVASSLESSLDGNNSKLFLINAKNTSYKCRTNNLNDDPGRSNQQPNFLIPKDLFTIDDDIDGDWWNV